MFRDKEGYKNGLDTVPGAPIIYATQHPQNGFKGLDFQEVLDSIDGRQVGTMGQAEVNMTGRPTFRAKTDITDSTIEEMIQKGEVLTSDGVWYNTDEDGHVTKITFDHLLIFPKSSGYPQRDPSALILNQYRPPQPNAGNNMPQDENTTKLLQNQQTKLDDQEKLLKDQATQLEDTKKLMQNQAAELKTLQEELKTFKDEKALAREKLILNQYVPGIQEQFKDRIEAGDLRDPEKAMDLRLEMDLAQTQALGGLPDLTKQSGNQFLANQGKQAAQKTYAEGKDVYTAAGLSPEDLEKYGGDV